MKSPEKCTNKLLKYIIQHSFRKLHLESIRCNVSDLKYAKLGNSFKFKFPQKNFLSFKGRFMCVCEGVQWGQMCVFVLLRVLHGPWQLPVRLKLICAISCLFAGCQHTHTQTPGRSYTHRWQCQLVRPHMLVCMKGEARTQAVTVFFLSYPTLIHRICLLSVAISETTFSVFTKTSLCFSIFTLLHFTHPHINIFNHKGVCCKCSVCATDTSESSTLVF